MIHRASFMELSGYLGQYFTICPLRPSLGQTGHPATGRTAAASGVSTADGDGPGLRSRPGGSERGQAVGAGEPSSAGAPDGRVSLRVRARQYGRAPNMEPGTRDDGILLRADAGMETSG